MMPLCIMYRKSIQWIRAPSVHEGDEVLFWYTMFRTAKNCYENYALQVTTYVQSMEPPGGQTFTDLLEIAHIDVHM